jgi:hypothetical protein
MVVSVSAPRWSCCAEATTLVDIAPVRPCPPGNPSGAKSIRASAPPASALWRRVCRGSAPQAPLVASEDSCGPPAADAAHGWINLPDVHGRGGLVGGLIAGSGKEARAVDLATGDHLRRHVVSDRGDHPNAGRSGACHVDSAGTPGGGATTGHPSRLRSVTGDRHVRITSPMICEDRHRNTCGSGLLFRVFARATDRYCHRSCRTSVWTGRGAWRSNQRTQGVAGRYGS